MKCLLQDVKQMKKLERGSLDYYRSGKIEIVYWNDNAVVSLGSNTHDVEQIDWVNWWVEGKDKQKVSQPCSCTVQ